MSALELVLADIEARLLDESSEVNAGVLKRLAREAGGRPAKFGGRWVLSFDDEDEMYAAAEDLSDQGFIFTPKITRDHLHPFVLVF